MRNIKYKEMPLKTAILLYPFLLQHLSGIDLSDPNYICRLDDDGLFEIGYRSDSVWKLC